MTSIANHYIDSVIGHLAALKSGATADAMARAAETVTASARAEGLCYVFGTGHSHMIAEEVHYRAGGLALAVPILATVTMLHEGALVSTVMERTEGIVEPIFSRYDITPMDTLFVVSNSGVNAAPVEAALIGREIGCTVVAITSLAYSTAAAGGRQRLADVSDIVIDNGIPPGDALVDVGDNGLRCAPASTAVAATIINAVFAKVAENLADNADAPVYVSANMPGAKAHNKALADRYRKRNPHL